MEWPGTHQRQRPKEEADNGAIVESKGPRRCSGPAAMAPDKRLLRARSRRVCQKKEKKERGARQSPLVCFSTVPSNADMREPLCGPRVFFCFVFSFVCVFARAAIIFSEG